MTGRLVLTADDSVDEVQLTAAIDDQNDHWYRKGESDDYVTHNGQICISIAQLQAVDSHNQMFECSIHLTDEQALLLRDWLTTALPRTAR